MNENNMLSLPIKPERTPPEFSFSTSSPFFSESRVPLTDCQYALPELNESANFGPGVFIFGLNGPRSGRISNPYYKSPSKQNSTTQNDRSSKSASFTATSPLNQAHSIQATSFPNLSASISQSITEKLRKIKFPDYNSITTDVHEWISLFESKMTEFNVIEQSVKIIIKFLDDSGLEFYLQTIGQNPGISWFGFKKKFVDYFENFKYRKIDEAISMCYTGGNLDDYLRIKIDLLKYALPTLDEKNRKSIVLSSIRDEQLISKILSSSNESTFYCQENYDRTTNQNDKFNDHTQSKLDSSFRSNTGNISTHASKQSEEHISQKEMHKASSNQNKKRDQIVCNWLRSNFTRTVSGGNRILVNGMRNKIQLHLKIILSPSKIDELVQKVFGPMKIFTVQGQKGPSYQGLKIREGTIISRKRNCLPPTRKPTRSITQPQESARIAEWLERNYEKSERSSDLIRFGELFERYSSYLVGLGETASVERELSLIHSKKCLGN